MGSLFKLKASCSEMLVPAPISATIGYRNILSLEQEWRTWQKLSSTRCEGFRASIPCGCHLAAQDCSHRYWAICILIWINADHICQSLTQKVCTHCSNYHFIRPFSCSGHRHLLKVMHSQRGDNNFPLRSSGTCLL